MLLPESQEAVEVVQDEARVFFRVFHLLQGAQIKRELFFPSGQH